MAQVVPVPGLAEEPVQLTVRGSQEDQNLLAALIWRFKAAYPGRMYDITLEAVEEPEILRRYQKDIRLQ